MPYNNQFFDVKVANIDEYINQVFGGIIVAVQKISYVAIAVAAVLSMLVTLFFALSGTDTIDSGSLTFAGLELSTLSDNELAYIRMTKTVPLSYC